MINTNLHSIAPFLSYCRLLTTREAAWYITLSVSVCLSDDRCLTFKRFDVHLVYLQGIQVKFVYEGRGQGQGQRSKKVENPYSRNVKLSFALTPV